MTTPNASHSLLVRQVLHDLGAGGTLARHLPGYEERSAQLSMARWVAQAIEEDVHMVCEAGTGTGKSDAYLVPAVRSGETVVVSTANKALQEQLFYKDIPFLQKHLHPFEAALVKGFSNYVCRDRVEEERMSLVHPDASFQDVVRATQEDTVWDGDLDTAPFFVSPEVRGRVNGDSDRCAWVKCQFYESCYQHRMRVHAERAQVIVTNHTLLLLDAAAENHILPAHTVTVVDESHGLEEEATRAFTGRVTASQLYTLLDLKAIRAYGPELLLGKIAQQTVQVWNDLDAAFVARSGSTCVVSSGPSEDGLMLASLLDDLARHLTQKPPGFLTERDEVLYKKLVTRVENLAARVRQVFARDQGVETRVARQADEQNEVILTYVYYLERTGLSSIAVCAAPLDVAPFLRKHLFDKGSVISCSATLATASSGGTPTTTAALDCAYYRRRVGLEGGKRDLYELVLPLVFDYSTQARLYVPRMLPEPRYQGEEAERYQAAIAEEMRQLVEASHGRAFLLFSSRRMLESVYTRLAPQLDYPLLKQGDMTRQELVRRFRREEGSVLFGLKSFWEGVDIAGEALSLVVIDKLPFDPPDDPVHEARVAQMKANGEDWFGGYVLNNAILRLKQGAGRLVRTRTDRGVMAVLDTRLHTKGYGRRVFASLPPAGRVTSVREVEQFFHHLTTTDKIGE